MTLKSETSLKSVNVKLEGIAKTVIQVTEEVNDRGKKRETKTRDEIEIHHVLYKTQTVFPPEDVRKSSTSNQFTLPPGSYTYAFRFKIPVNSDCRQNAASSASNSWGNGSNGWTPGGPGGSFAGGAFSSIANGRIGSSISNSINNVAGPGNKLLVTGRGIDIARAPSLQSHDGGVLPPSLSGIENSASIKYFVKVTVVRASMLKMNTRSHKPFIFLPLDPPRLYDSSKMAFVRRQITVGTSVTSPGGSKGRSTSSSGGGGFFSSLLSSQKVSSFMGVNTWPGETLSFTFEMRFPSVGTFVPLRPLPIELYALFPANPTTMTERKAIYISSFSVFLYARTFIRAHEHNKEIPLQLNVCDKKNLRLAVSLADAQPVTRNGQTVFELRLPSDLLNGVQFPSYVSPTFTTCNIARNYSIGVEMGFYCVQGIPVDHVGLLSDIIVRSGVSAPSENTSSALPPPPPSRPVQSDPPPEKLKYHTNAEDTQENGELPSYNEVVAATVGTSSSTQPEPRRKFEQAPDYYKISKE
ncbi:hypothetical protein AWJ20_3936 [Sugiyamaella lignohabitans]|uniref:Arrestin-like N-terminal domain-containing protein n=1 Tax=Sugiyamaella lignohabitans TaxID=796027 RepID=A0A161HGW4_9ASCO|nr:uncharacterized protein AWJ20_3936 [Sugiyamaella lignohabitans]ANB11137.1 hypothetical protein AWJ20_3936 [Sugiyamaella lignohabitans]